MTSFQSSAGLSRIYFLLVLLLGAILLLVYLQLWSPPVQPVADVVLEDATEVIDEQEGNDRFSTEEQRTERMGEFILNDAGSPANGAVENEVERLDRMQQFAQEQNGGTEEGMSQTSQQRLEHMQQFIID